MCSGGDTRALPRVGFPIRKSAGQRLFSTSPRLIAAVHVLHRLLTPRHPPRALRILTIEHTYCRYAVFKVRPLTRRGAGSRPATRPRDAEDRPNHRAIPESCTACHPQPGSDAARTPRVSEWIRVGGGGRTRSSTLFLGLAPQIDLEPGSSTAPAEDESSDGPEPWRWLVPPHP